MFQDFDTKKEKIDLSIAISVILIAGLFIGYYSFQTTNDSNPFGVEINNSEVESLTIESDTYVAENHETSEASAYPKTKNQTKENASEAVIIKSIDSVSIIEKIEVPEVSDQSLQGDKDALLSFKSKPNSGESDSETDSDISLVDEKSVAPIAADVIEKVLPKKEENVEAKIETKIAPKVETKKAIIDNKECIILIGAFAQSNNKEKLLNALKEEGFKTFQTPFKNLERIGIYESCERQRLTKTLKDIRKRFASDAMILKRQ